MKRTIIIVLLVLSAILGASAQNRPSKIRMTNVNRQLNRLMEKVHEKVTGEKVKITGGEEQAAQFDATGDELERLAENQQISYQEFSERNLARLEGRMTFTLLFSTAEVKKLTPEQQIAYGKQLLDDMEQINKKRESKQEAEGIKLNSSLSDLLGFNIDNYYKSQKQNRFFTPDRLKKQPTEKMALQINTLLSNAKGETMTSSGMERTKESINHTKEVVQQIDDMAEADLQRDKDALGILQMVCDKCGK